MDRKEAMQAVKDGFSEKVYEREGSNRWRVYVHSIRGIRTWITSRVPDHVFAEHKASGSSIIFTDGYFEVEAVEGTYRKDVVVVLEHRPRRRPRRHHPVNKGAVVGAVLGDALFSLLS